MEKRKNRLSDFLSKEWWKGVAVIVAIIAVVVAIIIGNKKLLDAVQSYSKSSQTKSPSDSTKQKEVPKIPKILNTYYGKGIACKGDSIRAWDEAYKRAKSNLSENLKDEKISVANASIDFAQSAKPILTENGWEATVVVFIKK